MIPRHLAAGAVALALALVLAHLRTSELGSEQPEGSGSDSFVGREEGLAVQAGLLLGEDWPGIPNAAVAPEDSESLRSGEGVGATKVVPIIDLQNPNRQEEAKKVVPIIDLQNPNRQEEAKKLREACLRVGFFYVTNHGVPKETVERAFLQTQRLFNLTLEQKMAMLANEHNRGYTRAQEELLDPTTQTEGDLKEGFYVGVEAAKNSELALQFPLFGPNIWPRESRGVLPGFKRDIQEYFAAMSDLGLSLSDILAESLGLPGDYFREFLTQPLAILRLLRYLPVASDVDKGKIGAGAHSDYGLITILATDEVGGLQVELKEGVWANVDPIPGTFVVNLGDMLARWSNDVYRSTRHRVVIKRAVTRYSMPFFYEPNHDTVVSCIPTICGESGSPSSGDSSSPPETPRDSGIAPPGIGIFGPPQKPRYAPILSGEYLLSKYHDTHADFKG